MILTFLKRELDGLNIRVKTHPSTPQILLESGALRNKLLILSSRQRARTLKRKSVILQDSKKEAKENKIVSEMNNADANHIKNAESNAHNRGSASCVHFKTGQNGQQKRTETDNVLHFKITRPTVSLMSR